MTLQVERVGDVAVVRIVGRLTEEELSDDLRTEAHAAAKSGEVNWILDVSKVETIDGSGLGEILAALTILSEAGGTLAVAKPSQGFHRFFNSPDLITGPSQYQRTASTCQWSSPSRQS